ncbi:MAG: hypothetical protein ACE5I9_04450 [Candidatus Methylomirabilales bacterium]
MRKCFRRNEGLSLLEVLLAAAILVVALLGIMSLFPTALQNVRYGGHMSQASSLAQEMVELMRTQPFATVSSYNGLDTRSGPPAGLPASVLNHFTQWANNIAPQNPSGALPQGWGTIAVALVPGLPDLLQLTVTVGWQERGNPTVNLVTYVAQYE